MKTLAILNKGLPDSYYIPYLLREVESEIHYRYEFDFKDLTKENLDNVDKIVLFGFPYKDKRDRRAIVEIGSKYRGIEIVHTCSYGGMIPDQRSYVDNSVKAPIHHLALLLGVEADTIVNLLNSYHKYDLSDRMVLVIRDLLETYKERFIDIFTQAEYNVTNLVKQNMFIIEQIHKQRQEYLTHKQQSAQIYNKDDVGIAFLYAERFTNEVAHAIMNNTSLSQYTKKVVIVGKHLPNSDKLVIRTENISADAIARIINPDNGRGNSYASSVYFSPVNSMIGDKLFEYLTTREDITKF